MEDIDRYAQRMEPPYEVVVYHHFEMALMNSWITKRWRRPNKLRRNMWPAPWRARIALPTMALVSMTYMSANGCGFTGISR